MAAKAKKAKNKDNSWVVAKEDNGTVQVTFTLPWENIEKVREKELAEIAKNVEVSGFRKGKAPISKAKEKISPEILTEKTLSKILPQMFNEALVEEKIKPAMYPKFELISAQENEDWQVRAVTCEMPEVDLGDYKKIIKSSAKSSDIWTPGKGDPKKKPEPTNEEKQNIVIKALVENYKIEVPTPLVESEVDSRLSSLLERIEKLGLSLESYLASVKKTAQQLREEYEEQAKGAIKLDIVLGKIAQEEKVTVTDKEIESYLSMSEMASGEKTTTTTPEQKNTIQVFLTKRKVIDHLAKLL